MSSSFEKEVLARISQKTSSSKTPEKALLAAIKFHDLSNTGLCDFEQFRAFSVKLGIQHYSELRQLFDMYDRERQTKINQRVLVNRLLCKPELDQAGANVNLSQSGLRDDGVSTYSVDPSSVERTFDVLLYKLNRSGISGILQFSNALRKFDVDFSNHITFDEFQTVLKDLQLDFSEDDIRGMFRYLESPQRLDLMDYSLLIKDLTSGMPQSRRDLVRTSYDRLDYSDTHLLDLKQLKSIFNPRNYAEVKSGRIHSEDIMADFFACIDLYTSMQRNQDSRVNAEQFLEFWEHISPAVQNDLSFDSLIRNCFRFNELPRKNKLEAPEYGNASMSPIYDKERFHPTESIQYTIFPDSGKEMGNAIYSIFEHLREQLAKRGPKGFVMLIKSMKNNDHDHDGKVSIKEFIKGLHEVRIELLDKETIAVFKSFDPKNTGFLKIDDFMHNFIPELNPRRSQIVSELLDSLGGTSGKVTYQAIKKTFNPRGHPDFLSNSKADYTIKEEFYLILDTYLGLTVGLNDYIPRATLQSFFELYSYAYVDDNYFENIIRGVFRLTKYNNGEPRQPRPATAKVGHDDDQVSTYSERPLTASVVNRQSNGSQYKLNAPWGTDSQEQRQQNRPQTASHASQRGGYQDEVENASRLEQSPPQQAFSRKTGSGEADADYQRDQSDISSAIQGMKEDMSVMGSGEKRENEFSSPRRNARHAPADFKVTFEQARHELIRQLALNPKGFLDLERQFVLIDTNKTRLTTIDQLSSCLGLINVKISNDELAAIFQRASKGEHRTNYLDLINELRGQMSKHREDGVISLYKDMTETTGLDYVTSNQMLKWFRADNHPDIVDRHLSPKQVHEEFTDKIDLFGRLGGFDYQQGVLTQDEFLEFFDGISAVEQNDERFAILIRDCFA